MGLADRISDVEQKRVRPLSFNAYLGTATTGQVARRDCVCAIDPAGPIDARIIDDDKIDGPTQFTKGPSRHWHIPLAHMADNRSAFVAQDADGVVAQEVMR